MHSLVNLNRQTYINFQKLYRLVKIMYYKKNFQIMNNNIVIKFLYKFYYYIKKMTIYSQFIFIIYKKKDQ